jgi:taurine dioxygenase
MSQDLHDDVVGEVRQAFLDHLVIFLRGQKVTPQQQVAFARRFGEPIEYPQLKGLPEAPMITPVVKLEHERNNFGGIWHSDTTYLEEPPMASMLVAREIPPAGGDTLFASMYAAYDALSEPMKRFLEPLTAMHEGEHVYRGRYGMDEAGKVYPKSEHPVIRTHPVSGRKALYVNRGFTTRIVQLKRPESEAVLQFLYRHVEVPEFQCRFRWQVNSVAFWDNRCVQHHAMWDYYPQRRHGHRVTIQGDTPFFGHGGPTAQDPHTPSRA